MRCFDNSALCFCNVLANKCTRRTIFSKYATVALALFLCIFQKEKNLHAFVPGKGSENDKSIQMRDRLLEINDTFSSRFVKLSNFMLILQIHRYFEEKCKMQNNYRIFFKRNRSLFDHVVGKYLTT